jgi:U6 snRNA-associated Sm-like protein LSm8
VFLQLLILTQDLLIDTDYLIEKVLVLTADGQVLIGVLNSFDQLTNLILENTKQRIIIPADEPGESEEIVHGLYIVRGDNVVAVGEVDEVMDAEINWTKVRGSEIRGVKNL